MRNHKCGTCRFYQEAQLASSGWCHHPQRKTTSDIMIMVRKNELACRDEWAHDLWEPKGVQAGMPAPPPGQFADRKERPATEAEIAAVLAASSAHTNQDESRADASDIVLSELGAGPEPNTYIERLEPPREWAPATSRTVEPTTSQHPATEHGSTARGAIIRAREAYRERSRQMFARSQEIARLASNAPQSEPAELAPPELEPPQTEPMVALAVDQSAASLDEPSAAGSAQQDLVRFETDDVVLANTDATGAAASEASGADEQVQVQQDPDEFEPERPSWMDDMESVTANEPLAKSLEPLARETEPAPRRRVEPDDPFDFGFGADRGIGREAPVDLVRSDDSARTARLEASDPSPVDRRSPERRPYPDRTSYWSASGPSARRHEPSDEPDFGEYHESDEAPLNSNVPDVFDEISATSRLIDLEAELEAEAIADPDDSDAGVDVVARDDPQDEVVIPIRPALSGHLPRICRTCRDFRPAETSDRGWCANQWAFSHRRVVAANEQAPCESVLGDWWLPVDDVWSDAADVSSHGQATPLLDAWLPEYQEKVPSRRRS